MPTTTAASIALVLCAVFGVLGFGWRSWLQYRRTGSAGFRGLAGRVGSTEWIAGVGFAAALMVTLTAPILQRANVIEPVGILRAVWVQGAGGGGGLIGAVGAVF